MKKIKDIFSELKNNYLYLKIPFYQRNYQWEEEHIASIFENFKIFEEKKNFYFGTIYLSEEFDNNGKLLGYKIIDGQQRLTTFLLLFLAYHRKFEQPQFNFSNIKIENDGWNTENGLQRCLNGYNYEGDSRYETNYRHINEYLNNYKNNELFEYFDNCNITLINFGKLKIIDELNLFKIINTSGKKIENEDILQTYLWYYRGDMDETTFTKEIKNFLKDNQGEVDLKKLKNIYSIYQFLFENKKLNMQNMSYTNFLEANKRLTNSHQQPLLEELLKAYCEYLSFFKLDERYDKVIYKPIFNMAKINFNIMKHEWYNKEYKDELVLFLHLLFCIKTLDHETQGGTALSDTVKIVRDLFFADDKNKFLDKLKSIPMDFKLKYVEKKQRKPYYNFLLKKLNTSSEFEMRNKLKDLRNKLLNAKNF